MNTPICDFVRRYAEGGALRLHMPGHKGAGPLGMEALDITEIEGADSLYEAGGIIRESEKNASLLFGAETLYSTEGSSLCIRAMLHLTAMYAKKLSRRPVIAAGRNAHKTFLSAAALLDLDVMWLYPEDADSYLACRLDADSLERALEDAKETPIALYITSPDYLGNVSDIGALAEVCRRNEMLLLVDNAHGAYLRFLPESRHPMDLGADLCCDSAHKTLPVLTGGAYLHLSSRLPEMLRAQAKNALALFGSTSPSYLILQSLDAANRHLAAEYPAQLAAFTELADAFKERLQEHGYALLGDEALKLTLRSKEYGYRGREYADLLLKKSIVCEFCDPDFVVMMLSPELGSAGLRRLEEAMLSIPRRRALAEPAPKLHRPQRALSIREAALSPAEILPAALCEGRVLAAASVGCPPAVPIVVCGERIDRNAVDCFAYYGIESCSVVIEGDHP